jgi:hypothetical protein
VSHRTSPGAGLGLRAADRGHPRGRHPAPEPGGRRHPRDVRRAAAARLAPQPREPLSQRARVRSRAPAVRRRRHGRGVRA